MLTKLSLDTQLDREFVGRHQAERVQIAEVPYFQYWRKYALEVIIKLLFIFPYIMINVYYSC